MSAPFCPSLPARARTAERRGPWVACVLLVLVGLFGMHGLADHGMGTDAETPMADSTSASGPHGHAVAPPATAAEPGDGSPRGPGDLAAGLCLAVLVGLLVGLALLVSVRRRLPLTEHLLRLIATARPRGGDPDPPTLPVLSVWRC